MNIEKLIHARKLIDFIENEINLELIPSNNCPYDNHIGALFTDIILQAGLNYKHIVSPRVNNVYTNYPEAYTVKKFLNVIEVDGLENIINWKHEIKLKRISDLIFFCIDHKIDSTEELKLFLLQEENKKQFLMINGIGSKTYDYLLKLMNVDTIAVDRHIYSFLEKAGIKTKDYDFSKGIVEFAADIMNVSRRSIDYSIWSYMAYSEKKESEQFVLEI
jgi:hypothetical protein